MPLRELELLTEDLDNAVAAADHVMSLMTTYIGWIIGFLIELPPAIDWDE
jgi:hypothetical protein